MSYWTRRPDYEAWRRKYRLKRHGRYYLPRQLDYQKAVVFAHYEGEKVPPGLKGRWYLSDSYLRHWMAEVWPDWGKRNSEAFTSNLWRAIRGRVELDDDPPAPDLVAFAVRHGTIPENMRDFVADLIVGKVKRRRGPSRQPVRSLGTITFGDHPRLGGRGAGRWLGLTFSPLEKHRPGELEIVARSTWCYRVLRWKLVYERRRTRRPAGMHDMEPYRNALETVSRESGISEHTLDSWLYPRS